MEVPAPVTEAGVKVTETPAGRFVALRVTTELKDPALAIVIVESAAAPVVIVAPVEAASVNVDWATTVKDSVAVRVRLDPLLVPVIVTVLVPRLAPAVAAKVIVEVPEPPETVAGENTAVTPLGSPLAVRFTDSANPLLPVTVSARVPSPEASILKLVRLLKLKSGASEVVKFKEELRTTDPAAPWTLSVTVPVAALTSAFSVKVVVAATAPKVRLAGLNV